MKRPTPEQLAESPNDIISISKRQLLADLRSEGYVIVHRDDVPPGRMPPMEPGRVYVYTPGTPTYEDGWDDCRRLVLGADA